MKIDTQTLTDFGIPGYMHDGIVRYFENGIRPGSFLCAIINNDLRAAVAFADSTNKHIIHRYVQWLYSVAPSSSWGYDGAVSNFIENYHGIAEDKS